MLEEVSPGVDIERDIIAKMEFKPIVSNSIREMDENLFKVGKVGIRDQIMRVLKK